MNCRRRKPSLRSASLTDEEWRGQPRVHLYCIDYPNKPRYLATYLLCWFKERIVAADHGGGHYLFIVVHRGRILHRGVWDIEGNPIRRPRLPGERANFRSPQNPARGTLSRRIKTR